MQLKKFFEKSNYLHNRQGSLFYSICNLDFWIIYSGCLEYVMGTEDTEIELAKFGMFKFRLYI